MLKQKTINFSLTNLLSFSIPANQDLNIGNFLFSLIDSNYIVVNAYVDFCITSSSTFSIGFFVPDSDLIVIDKAKASNGHLVFDISKYASSFDNYYIRNNSSTTGTLSSTGHTLRCCKNHFGFFDQ